VYEKEFLKCVGQNITKFRKAKKLTITELGYLCDMEKSNIIPIEKGRINATCLTLLKIANALDINVMDLFDFNYKTPTNPN
jgi:transcriptional regulator with XRE-family HTH domain